MGDVFFNALTLTHLIRNASRPGPPDPQKNMLHHVSTRLINETEAQITSSQCRAKDAAGIPKQSCLLSLFTFVSHSRRRLKNKVNFKEIRITCSQL